MIYGRHIERLSETYCTAEDYWWWQCREWKGINTENWQEWSPWNGWSPTTFGVHKVKVTRPINTVTKNQPYLQNRKAYKLQTWYTDEVQWPASPTCAVTSKLKALDGCSNQHLQRAGAYCVGNATGRTSCLPLSAFTLLVWLWCRELHWACETSCHSDHHHHHHIYFRLPERPQKPIELATMKQQKENCKNEKYKKVIKNDFKNIKQYAARPKQTITTTWNQVKPNPRIT